MNNNQGVFHLIMSVSWNFFLDILVMGFYKLGRCRNFWSFVWLQQIISAVDLVNVNDLIFEVAEIFSIFYVNYSQLYRGAQGLTQPSGFRGFQPDNGLFMKLFLEAPYGYSVMIGSCATFRSNVWLQQTSSAVDFVNVNDPIFESKA